jgi:dienelactone hydrolase
VALNELKKGGAIAQKIAVIGYCFGGTGALEAARGNLSVAGAVCIHGSLYKDSERKNTPIRTKVLIEHPDDDPTVTQEDYNKLMVEMKESNADWQIITYGGAKHTFTNLKSPDYNETMAKRAWGHTISFLQEVLK